MLNLNLDMYRTQYTSEEKRALEDCFKQIQAYLQRTIISNNPVRRVVEYQIERDSYTKTYLVVNCNLEGVYLTRGNHGGGDPNFYFTGDFRESQQEGWKYIICAAVIDHWDVIKEEIHDLFGECQSVLELCESFNV